MSPLPHGARVDAKGYFRFRSHTDRAPEIIAAHTKFRCPAASRRPGRSRKARAFQLLIKQLAASPTAQPNSRGEHQGGDLDNRLPFETVERAAP
jgi:hypothetical protein